jgi:deoxyribodipyrimidine photo-lyase
MNSILVWFRRDLRDRDHTALCEALRRGRRVYCAFVFDREILDRLGRSDDRRVEFIRESLVELDLALRVRGGAMIVRHGWASSEIPTLARELGVSAVFANRDYEPQAKKRDAAVRAALSADGIAFESFKDQAVLDGEEVLTQAGRPYTVFTPYRNAWLKRLTEDDWQPCQTGGGCLMAAPGAGGVPPLAALGFAASDLRSLGFVPGMSGGQQLLAEFQGRMARYRQQRDFPAVKGVSYLSLHLRFGTVSIRELVARAIAAGALKQGAEGAEGAATWLAELIWRDFYFMILDRFPHVTGGAFKPGTMPLPGNTGRRRRRPLPPGATGAPAIRWSTPRCGRSTGLATCITACACWSLRF